MGQGGFDPDAVATANILESSSSEVGGQQYHSLSVENTNSLQQPQSKINKLYIYKAQAKVQGTLLKVQPPPSVCLFLYIYISKMLMFRSLSRFISHTTPTQSLISFFCCSFP